MILSKTSATFWDLALVRFIPYALWMRRGTDFGAAVAKSQVAATNPLEIVREQARSFQHKADPLPALNPPELT
jgi:hypothetical protein